VRLASLIELLIILKINPKLRRLTVANERMLSLLKILAIHLKSTITMKVSRVWEMIGKTFVEFRFAKSMWPMLFMVPLKVVMLSMLFFESISLRNISEEPNSELSEARIPTPTLSKNTINHRNYEVPEEDNPSETGNYIIDEMQARVYKPSENGKQVNLKLKLIFMVKSPIIFAIARLAIFEWAGLFYQWQQLYLAVVYPGLGYYKVENKGVLEEAMMLKIEKLQNRNFLLCLWSVTVGVWARFVSVLMGIFPFRIFH